MCSMFASNHLQCLGAGPSVVHCGLSLLPSQDRTLPDCCSEHVKYDMLLLTSRSVPDKKLKRALTFHFPVLHIRPTQVSRSAFQLPSPVPKTGVRCRSYCVEANSSWVGYA